MTILQKSFSIQAPATLYLVVVPIGNLNEISNRALEILQTVDIIYCEHTLYSQRLLHKYNIHKPLRSCFKDNEKTRSKEIIKTLKQGHNLSLISSAGMPIISDPGQFVVSEVLQANYQVVPIGCNNAALACYIASGLLTRYFIFIGFLSKKKEQQLQILEQYHVPNCAILLYESPLRIIKTLTNLFQVYPWSQVCVAKEISKKHEQFIRGNIKDVLTKIEKLSAPKGEYTLALDLTKPAHLSPAISKKEIIKKIRWFIKSGMSNNEALKATAYHFNLKRNFVFNLYYQDHKNQKSKSGE